VLSLSRVTETEQIVVIQNRVAVEYNTVGVQRRQCLFFWEKMTFGVDCEILKY
jgi:hypothetical protein